MVCQNFNWGENLAFRLSIQRHFWLEPFKELYEVITNILLISQRIFNWVQFLSFSLLAGLLLFTYPLGLPFFRTLWSDNQCNFLLSQNTFNWVRFSNSTFGWFLLLFIFRLLLRYEHYVSGNQCNFLLSQNTFNWLEVFHFLLSFSFFRTFILWKLLIFSF